MRRSFLVAAAVTILAGLAWLFLSRDEAPTGQAPGQHQALPEPPAPQRQPKRQSTGLRGTVALSEGAPAPGALVHLSWESGSKEATVDGEGRFSFSGLAPGDFTLVARLGDLASERLGPIPLAEGEELEGLSLVLSRGASLAGIVSDAQTGETLQGVRLELGGQVAISDHAGRFRFVGLSPGVSSLVALAKGYEPRVQELALPQGETSGVELRLEKGAEVRGIVVDPDGLPVAGAVVSASRYRLGGGGEGTGPGQVATDEGGRFSLVAPMGQVDLRAVGPSGAVGHSAPLDLAPGTVRSDVVIRLEPTSSLWGQVVAWDDSPVPGAQVHLGDLEGRSLASTATGGDGRFSFGSVAAGMVRLTAVKGTARGLAGPIGVGGGEGEPVVIQLGGGILEGTVEDAIGTPVPGAQVAVWPEGGTRTLASLATTRGDGSFRLEGLPEGALRVEAHGREGRAERRAVFADEEPLILVLGSGRLVGRVLLDGRAASDFTLTVAPLEPGGAGARSERFVVPDGRFGMELPPGRYELRATLPGEGLARAVTDVPSMGDSEEVLLEMDSGGAIEGTILSPGGSPLEGVRVSIYRGGTWAFGQGSAVGRAFQSITGADGRFRLSGLPSGRFPIFAWRPGLEQARPVFVEVEAGSTVAAEIRLAEAVGEQESAFGGIGMTLMAMGEGVGVAWVVDDGPAWEAGVRRGDRVVAIDGVAVRDLGEATGRVRGPVGTQVILSLQRGDVPFRAVATRTEVRF